MGRQGHVVRASLRFRQRRRTQCWFPLHKSKQPVYTCVGGKILLLPNQAAGGWSEEQEAGDWSSTACREWGNISMSMQPQCRLWISYRNNFLSLSCRSVGSDCAHLVPHYWSLREDTELALVHAMDEVKDTVPSWLSREFLQTAVRSGDPSAVVKEWHVRTATSIGDNFLGTLYRASVTLACDTQRSLIIKCFPSEVEKRQFMKEACVFETEIEMYSKTLPQMYGVLGEFFPAVKPFTPQFVYSDPKCEVIVLEDISAKGFTLGKRRRQGLDMEHCTKVVKRLALFHAVSAALHCKNPASMAPYQEGLFKEKTRQFLETYVTCSIRELARELQTWPEFAARYSEKLNRLMDVFWDNIRQAVSCDDNGFNVLNHGDLWLNNLMFRYSGEDIEDVTLLDLQLCHFSSPAVDLLYFMYTSPCDSVRQLHYDNLIETYHQHLCECLHVLQLGHKAPTMSQLQHELKSRLSVALFAAICELPSMLAEPQNNFDLAEYFRENGRQPPQNNTFGGSEYKRVIQRLLPVFDSYGVL